MTVHLSTPEGLLQQDLYHPVAVASGPWTAFFAGQVAVRPDGGVVAEDLAGQVHAALRNVVTAVRSAGGGPGDLVRLTTFVVGWKPEDAAALEEGVRRAQASDGLPSPLPPLTVIGVQALYRPEILVEIEGTAVLDRAPATAA